MTIAALWHTIHGTQECYCVGLFEALPGEEFLIDSGGNEPDDSR